MKNHHLRHTLAIGTALCSLAAIQAPAPAIAQSAVREYHIKAQPLAAALKQFAADADMQILYSEAEVAGRMAPMIDGRYSAEEVIRRLLDGSGLAYSRSVGNTIVVHPAKAQEPPIPGEFEAGQGPAGSPAANNGDALPIDQVDQEIVVTGTNIRNVQQKLAPVISMTREDLDLAGYASPADYIQQLPQNFGGGGTGTPDRASAGDTGPGFSSVNLRGLGTEASLVLLNGRRVAPSGTAGAAVDISMIPSAALQRVDVLTDGASAVYGADAVAGVVNFILRRRYVGNETRVRVGSKSGDATDYKLSHTWGSAGERSRVLVSYEYAAEQALNKDDREYTDNLATGNEILPRTRKHAFLLSAGLDWSSGSQMFVDIYYARRKSRQDTFFTGPRVKKASSNSLNGTLGINLPLGHEWMAEFSASMSVADFVNKEHGALVNSQPGHLGMWNDEHVWSVDAKAEGPLFELPGGGARGVIGAQYRRETHDGAMDLFDVSGRPTNRRQSEADVRRQVKSAYAEIYAPVADSLELGLAARYDSYSTFGSTFNPKLGLAWAPFEGMTLRGSYGTSFKAPRLQLLVDKINYVMLYDYIDPATDGVSVAAFLYGSRSDLDAEESTSKSFGIDLNPSWAPQLSATFNYYSINYTGRIANPSPQTDSTYKIIGWPLPVDRSVTLEQLNAWVAQATNGLVSNFTTQLGGSNSGLEDVTVLFDGRPTNTSSSRQRGIDANVRYRWTLNSSTLVASFAGSYILDAEDQFSSLLEPVQQYGLIFKQARFRARSGLNWTRGVLSTNLAANYVSSYKDDRFTDRHVRIAPWLTFDASVQYRFDDARGPAWLNGSWLTLSVQNVLDKNPPRILPPVNVSGGSPNDVAYDSANADPYGRWMSIQFTKQW